MTQETKIIGGIALVTLIIFVGALFIFGGDQEAKTETPLADAAILSRNAEHTIATSSATVSIVEFADFQCPACKLTHPVIKQILSEYKGKVNFTFRHFPLPQHKNAVSAGIAAEAAGEMGGQGKFFEMYDMLYNGQTEWSESNKAKESYIFYAKTIGLDTIKFEELLNSKVNEDVINKDKSDGLTLGVNSTPTLFINRKQLEVSADYTNIKAAVESELKK